MWKLLSYFSFGRATHTSTPKSPPAESRSRDVGQQGLSVEDAQDIVEERLLVASPYTTRPHLLDLTTLTQSQILLARALTILTPVTHAYATSPYIDSFNWDAVLTYLAAAIKSETLHWKEQYFYIVVFRSQVPPSTDRSHLAELDKAAHVEAMRSGGLLKYWFGTPDVDGRNVATCKQLILSLTLEQSDSAEGVWRRREDAAPGSSGEGHKAAMRATVKMYSEWNIERLKLVVKENAGQWNIIPWAD
ncbi:MAG: hypothetical protein LQ343_004956 [Gyalolechia ehrenbergii]|nr:MAG: hypothetical protein LQ343_004956 [Gyalolechia ehrenbergii]